jgi:tol-pal system protein YbgF
MRKLAFAVAATSLLSAVPAVSDAAQLRPLQNVPGTQQGLAGAPVIQVQAVDASRVNQLEEQIRQLTGKVEELNFQLLQMEEQMRKRQENDEFRFQEIEDKLGQREQSGGSNAVAGSQEGGSLGKPEPSGAEGNTALSDADSAGAPDNAGVPMDGAGMPMDEGGAMAGETPIDRKSISDLLGNGDPGRTVDGVEVFDPSKQPDGTGSPPAPLGSLVFDQDGNVVDSNVGKPIDLLGKNRVEPSGSPDNPSELFNLGYQYIQGGQYENAARTFNEFSARYPADARIAEALFWEGESHFSLGEYEAAARIFLKNHKAHPDSELGAENLLKLGVSLAGMNQRELACATYAEVPKKYPNSSNAVRSRLKVEQASAKCVN